MRGVISSTLFLSNLLRVTNCDFAIISEHKLKQSSLYYMNSIDTLYHSIAKSDRWNDIFICAHDKGCIYMIYKSALQFLEKEMVDAKSDRIVGNEPRNQNYRSIFRSVLVLH
jgi:hypothetical protein